MSLTPNLSLLSVQTKALPLRPHSNSEEAVYAAAQKYSSVFFTQFVQEMMEGLESVGGFGEEMYRTLLADAIGETLATSPSGQELTQILATQMNTLQDGHQKPSPATVPYFKEGRA